jgi:hypothetical protein
MATHYQLYDGTNTYNLDSNAKVISFGYPGRINNFVQYAGGNGAVYRGFGRYTNRQISITFRFRESPVPIGSSDRQTLVRFLTLPSSTDLWLRRLLSDESTWTKIKVYPQLKANEVYNTMKISDRITINFETEKAFFEAESSTTGSSAISDSTEHNVSITNGGDVDCPLQIKFTPTVNETRFKVTNSDGNGIILGGAFNAGDQVVYDTSDNTMTIAAIDQTPQNYIVNGSPFTIPTGTNDVYVTCSGAGTFAYSFEARYL